MNVNIKRHRKRITFKKWFVEFGYYSDWLAFNIIPRLAFYLVENCIYFDWLGFHFHLYVDSVRESDFLNTFKKKLL